MGHNSKTCPCCAISRIDQEKIKELKGILSQYQAKMAEASSLLIQQNYELHDLRDLLKARLIVSDQKH